MMSSPSANDIQTLLKYTVNDGVRPFNYSYTKEDGTTGIGGSWKQKDVVVRDARSLDRKLDQHAFELVDQETSLSTSDFYNDKAKIKDVYYKEMESCIRLATGAAKVVAFQHDVRNQGKKEDEPSYIDDASNATKVNGYADSIHTDVHEKTAKFVFVFRAFKSVNLEPKYLRGRFVYLNAWRNIADAPIGNDHLAVLDQTSIVGAEDYMEMDLFSAVPETGLKLKVLQHCLNEKNSEQHRWHYFSKMTKDEVLLFKQFDSDPKLPGRMCFHTSFKDPKAAVDLPYRQSIEVRALAFFPDHEPNTCPGTVYCYIMVMFMRLQSILQSNFLKKQKTWLTVAIVAGALFGIAGLYFKQ